MAAIIPVKDLSTEEILYGSRETEYRYEVLRHTLEQKYNMCPNPKGSVDTSWWSSTPGSSINVLTGSGTGMMQFLTWILASGPFTATGNAFWCQIDDLTPGRTYQIMAVIKRGSIPADLVVTSDTGTADLVTIAESDIDDSATWVTGEFMATQPTHYLQMRVGEADSGVFAFMYQISGVAILESDDPVTLTDYFDGDSLSGGQFRYDWTDTPGISKSVRTFSGLDYQSLGLLDGVQMDSSQQWSQTAAVKGSMALMVRDLDVAKPGMLRLRDLDLMRDRIRPVMAITGLPEIPLGMYLFTADAIQQSDTGSVHSSEMLDITSAIEQDIYDVTFIAGRSKSIIGWVNSIIKSAGEMSDFDATDSPLMRTTKYWPAGTSKLTVINELLDTIGYDSLRIDGNGNFIIRPYVKPANRPAQYEIPELGSIDRELIDGEESIYSPEWTYDKDMYQIPNKVVAISTGDGENQALVGRAYNIDLKSPYSYQNRGRWITSILDGVEVPDGTRAEQLAALTARAERSLIAMSAPQASIDVTHLPLPISVGDVMRFANAPGGVDSKHIVTSIQFTHDPLALMSTTFQEVLDL